MVNYPLSDAGDGFFRNRLALEQLITAMAMAVAESAVELVALFVAMDKLRVGESAVLLQNGIELTQLAFLSLCKECDAISHALLARAGDFPVHVVHATRHVDGEEVVAGVQLHGKLIFRQRPAHVISNPNKRNNPVPFKPHRENLHNTRDAECSEIKGVKKRTHGN